MAFGLSFGANKKTTKTDTTVNKTEVGSQTGTESTLGQQSSTTQGSQTNQSQGQSSTSQQSSQQGTTSTTGTKTSQQSSFSDALGQGIEGAIGDLLGGLGETGTAIGRGVEGLQGFDPNSFVSGIMEQATARQNLQLDQAVNGVIDTAGGGVGSNSMAALLAGRLGNDAAANLAGINSQAVGQANEIMRGNLGATADSMGSLNALAPALINAFKGANVSGTETNLAQEIANVLGQQTGTTQTEEQSAQNTQSQTLQTIAQIVQNLLNSNMTTTGTESSVSTEKKKGGGLSLGF